MSTGRGDGERAVLVGTDTLRLLRLATELEARGLEVAVFRDLGRALTECAAGRCAVLVALGQPQSRLAGAQPVAVPLVLIDVPEPAQLPLRPLGPRTALPADLPTEVVVERILALVAMHARPGGAPPAPAAPPAEVGAAAPRTDLATLRREHAARLAQAAAPSTRRRPRWLKLVRWAAIVAAGLAVGYLVGMAWLSSTMAR
jgi:hypothetical protein